MVPRVGPKLLVCVFVSTTFFLLAAEGSRSSRDILFPTDSEDPSPGSFANENNLTKRVTRAELNRVIVAGSNAIDIENEFEEFLSKKDVHVTEGTASFSHFLVFQTSPEAVKVANQAIRVLEASKQLKKKLQLTELETNSVLSLNSALETDMNDMCLPEPRCKSSNYRTMDGSCNNLRRRIWGKSLTATQRMLPAQYSDGIFEPRKAVDGSELPGARLVSTSLVPDVDTSHNGISLMTMTFGQFVDHDLILSPVFAFANGSGIECCTRSGDFQPKHLTHPHCFPIELPRNDPFYGPLNRRCMNFVRTMPGMRPNCTFGSGEQLNSITHWLDGSQIYGNSDSRSNRLRSFRGGKLRTSSENGLPNEPRPTAGDVRVGEQPQLLAIHTIWMREHNRVAGELGRLNPHWNDETLFQEARKVVIAELVHIIYAEFLPLILGKNSMDAFNLTEANEGFSFDYDEDVNPAVINEFSTAAFRMGHSLIQGIIKLFNDKGSDRNIDQTFTISSVMSSRSQFFQTRQMDRITAGLLNQPIQNFDNSLSAEMTTKLFSGGGRFGMDLASLNIQRGRDHGLPGYIIYREICGLPKVKSFDELKPMISDEAVEKFKKVYRSVEDVDLFIGGLNEVPEVGALVGPTFVCIIGQQFSQLKKADRFFFDLGGQPHSFNLDQLQEIRKATLARVICDNNDGSIQSIQPLALQTPTGRNFKVECNSMTAIKRIDFSPWTDSVRL